MKDVILYRRTSTDEGTFGFMVHNGSYWYSLELPNHDNQKNISSIPYGTYICTLRYSPHFKRDTYWVTDVDGRDYILIHSANLAGDVALGYQSHLNGCIALGKSSGTMLNKFGNKQHAIFSSRTAVRQFMSEMAGKDFKLHIKDL